MTADSALMTKLIAEEQQQVKQLMERFNEMLKLNKVDFFFHPKEIY